MKINEILKEEDRTCWKEHICLKKSRQGRIQEFLKEGVQPLILIFKGGVDPQNALFYHFKQTFMTKGGGVQPPDPPSGFAIARAIVILSILHERVSTSII